jgi:uncharacterized protein (DUF4415 family)
MLYVCWGKSLDLERKEVILVKKKDGRGRPRLPPGKRKIGISIRLSPEVIKWLKKQGENRSAVVELLCKKRMEGEA